jgi:hypothetical protein
MKKMLISIIAMISILTLAGCATPAVFNKPGISQTEFSQDLASCKYDAVKYGQVSARVTSTAIGAGIEEALRQREVIIACMASKGYSK